MSPAGSPARVRPARRAARIGGKATPSVRLPATVSAARANITRCASGGARDRRACHALVHERADCRGDTPIRCACGAVALGPFTSGAVTVASASHRSMRRGAISKLGGGVQHIVRASVRVMRPVSDAPRRP